MSVQSKPAAIIYTHSLLEGSCTFIKSHAEALTRHKAVYVGAHRVEGLELPADRTFVVNDGTPIGLVREAAFRVLGRAPALVKAVREHDPRIVHAHFGNAGPAAMSLAGALAVPLLVTFHGADATVVGSDRPRSHRDRELKRKKGR
jgi:colanic acid/amylovoran biosynthesis glycosyltransferase